MTLAWNFRTAAIRASVRVGCPRTDKDRQNLRSQQAMARDGDPRRQWMSQQETQHGQRAQFCKEGKFCKFSERPDSRTLRVNECQGKTSVCRCQRPRRRLAQNESARQEEMLAVLVCTGPGPFGRGLLQASRRDRIRFDHFETGGRNAYAVQDQLRGGFPTSSFAKKRGSLRGSGAAKEGPTSSYLDAIKYPTRKTLDDSFPCIPPASAKMLFRSDAGGATGSKAWELAKMVLLKRVSNNQRTSGRNDLTSRVQVVGARD